MPMRREYVFATASADNIKKWKCPSVVAEWRSDQ